MHFRKLGHGDDEQDAISPLGRSRSSNGDSSFPLRKTGTFVTRRFRLRSNASKLSSFETINKKSLSQY